MSENSVIDKIDEHIEKKLKNACKKCKGFCCMIFSLPHSRSELKMMVKQPENFSKSYVEGAIFAVKNFRRLKASFGKNYLYTCKRFNWSTGKCRCHDKRPELCQNFHCEQAWVGKSPLSAKGFFIGDYSSL